MAVGHAKGEREQTTRYCIKTMPVNWECPFSKNYPHHKQVFIAEVRSQKSEVRS
ncbi:MULTISPECIES: hypothetical protein [Moorena]|uniref:hypothetical protein n=1 Tax=Moorena TaxID=1155738 RepID=UPI0002D454B6|nr:MULTISPECIES: hypothetical protein [Moorena]NEP31477.1 hypothetical protein [Moorena sp. SIO3B2]NEQ15807.1 hypothetical protein [Moorena sp. SIO3E2]NES45905.1 hypothetical protein [Moorena sp. SIO2C4]